ncbi:hypothetical protein [Affinibrenneria salicis]|uniref:hypothetical protein n=1 Tax=Affinibrenneria salicis TaxID=2590031 RepID=UPI00168BC5F5|nr:hypothetical protein [Affinibrenneria salicis]
MLLIVGPFGGDVSPAGAAALSSAFACALYQILMRRVRDVATTLDITLQVALVG